MRLLGGYIGRSVLFASLAVLLVIVTLDLVFSLLDELGGLRGDYGLFEAVIYMLMRLPERFYLFLPIAALVGVLVGLGGLASTSELTVMRAAGVSIPRLIWQAAKPIAVLLLVAMLASEFVLLQWVQAAESYRWEKRTGQQMASVSSARDLWLKEERQFYRIQVARDDGQLLGVTIYQLDANWQLSERITAARADWQEQEGRWVLRDVQRLRLDPEQLQQERLPSLVWPVPIAPEFVALQAFDPRDLPPTRLWHYAHYLEARGQPSGFYWLALWQKLLLPITVFAVVLLGASFTFGPLRSVPAGTRVFHGILIGLSVKFAQDLLGPAALLWGFPPILAVLIPAGFCAAWGGWQIYRTG
ncbi:LPS export ABC transporter permease LptG [Marinospirillum sp.]|uniref:LPS export ABC transporter permease LptG n=1 Tax=Marinospirillum sp. TaxID=2183934 RepID=UPI003A852B08